MDAKEIRERLDEQEKRELRNLSADVNSLRLAVVDVVRGLTDVTKWMKYILKEIKGDKVHPVPLENLSGGCPAKRNADGALRFTDVESATPLPPDPSPDGEGAKRFSKEEIEAVFKTLGISEDAAKTLTILEAMKSTKEKVVSSHIFNDGPSLTGEEGARSGSMEMGVHLPIVSDDGSEEVTDAQSTDSQSEEGNVTQGYIYICVDCKTRKWKEAKVESLSCEVCGKSCLLEKPRALSNIPAEPGKKEEEANKVEEPSDEAT